MDFHITSITKGGLEVRPSKRMIATAERIHDPQDLEDGLLSVAYDEMKEAMTVEVNEASRRRILELFVRR